MLKIQQKKEDEQNLKVKKQEQFKALLADVKKYRIIVKEDIDEETKLAAWNALTKRYPIWSAGVKMGQWDKILAKADDENKDGGFNIFEGRFIANDDATVLDIRTNLMWAAKDNGVDITWADAQAYCKNYQVGSYTDWRMPTKDELRSLYDGSIDGYNSYHLTKLITVTGCCPWASEISDSDAAYLFFYNGNLYLGNQYNAFYGSRALPVRSAK
jgi:hypothetical protein